MSTTLKLDGWNIGIAKRKFTESGEDGLPQQVEGFALIFTEVMPATGNQIVFECTKEIADQIVSEITGVILPGIDDLRSM